MGTFGNLSNRHGTRTSTIILGYGGTVGRGRSARRILPCGEISEASAKVHDGRGVDLRDAGLNNAEDESDLFHGGFLIVVEGHYQAFALGQVADGLDQP